MKHSLFNYRVIFSCVGKRYSRHVYYKCDTIKNLLFYSSEFLRSHNKYAVSVRPTLQLNKREDSRSKQKHFEKRKGRLSCAFNNFFSVVSLASQSIRVLNKEYRQRHEGREIIFEHIFLTNIMSDGDIF